MAIDIVGVKYEADVSDLQKGLDEAVQSQVKLGKQAEATGEAIKGEGKKATTAMKTTDKEVQKLTESTKKLKTELSPMQKMMQSAGKAFAAAFAVQKLITFGKQIIDVTARFEKYRAVLVNTLGSNSEAQKSMAMIQKFAAETPFGVDELTSSFVKLANQGFKPTADEMRSLGDLAAANGKSFDQLTEAIIDAQTGEFERLKEFGIRASKEGDNVTFAFKGVQTQTEFTSDAIREYILGLGQVEGVSGGMAAISQTLSGRISNLGDAWDSFLLSLGDSGFGNIVAHIIGGLSSMLDAISDTISRITDPIAYYQKQSDQKWGEYFATIEAKAKDYSRNMTEIEIQGQIERLEVQRGFRERALFEAAMAGDREAAQMEKQRIKTYNAEIETLRGMIEKKGEEERKANEKNRERLRAAEEKRLAEEKKRINDEFTLQQLRINVMQEGIGKEIAARDLAYEREKLQFKDNKEALLLIEQKYWQDIEAIRKKYQAQEIGEQQVFDEELIKQEERAQEVIKELLDQRIKALLTPQEYEQRQLKQHYDTLRQEVGDNEEALALINEDFERKKAEVNDKYRAEETAKNQAAMEGTIQTAQAAYEGINAIGEMLIQDEAKRAEFMKAMTLFKLGISTAEAISKATASAAGVPFPANIAAIALAVGTVLTNIAAAKQALQGAQAPAFKDGVIDLQGPGTGTSDSIPAWLSKGESVMTNKETRTFKDELKAMRAGNYADLITQKYVLPVLRAQQADTAQRMATGLKLQASLDDDRIVTQLGRIKPATAKDIERLGSTLARQWKDTAYRNSKTWKA